MSFVALPGTDECLRMFRLEGASGRQTCEEFATLGSKARRAGIEAFQRAVRTAQVIAVENANHYVFLSNEADVLRGLQRFLNELAIDK